MRERKISEKLSLALEKFRVSAQIIGNLCGAEFLRGIFCWRCTICVILIL
jgi:hypothetical protein